ncbi:hypothetical protein [Streptomyces sp. NPDC001480]|uniref:hypothetical protein n=1 Tax=Streptomyces sp. NPDC001480 TaxID=3364577 RepID=UPI00369AD330
MATASAAPVVAPPFDAFAGTVAIVAPCGSSVLAEACARQGRRTVAVEPGADRRPPTPVPARRAGACTDSVEHRGSLRQTVKVLRGLGVTAVVAGSAAGVGLAERIAWHLGLPQGDPETSPLRYDRGLQAAALARAGIPAPRGIRSAHPAEALAWAEACRLPGCLPAPAAAEVPVQPVDRDGTRRIGNAWPAVERAAARYSGDAHLVLTERLPAPQFVVNSVSRPGADGRTEHVVTDVWAETRSRDRAVVRTDLLLHHEPLTRVLSAYMRRVLDALGVMRGPVTARVAHDDSRGPLLVSALAVPGISLADEALRGATGYDRLTDVLGVLDAWGPPLPARSVPGPAGHRVVRFHLHRRGGDAVDPHLGRIVRRLPTVDSVSADLLGQAPVTGMTQCAEIVLSGDDPEAVEADCRIIRALARGSLHGGARPMVVHPSAVTARPRGL